MATTDGDYVLGTGDEEVQRLGVQHRVWRARVVDAWARAGFSHGQHLVDVGCGPGYATVDLAGIAGAEGRITAIDRSPYFLGALTARLARGGCTNADIRQLDLDVEPLPRLDADGAWCRWILAFVRDPKHLVAGLHDMLRPGGTLVLHEYFDYRMWRLMPRSAPFEEFVGAIIDTWREAGGEPEIAMDILPWLSEAGFDVVETRPLVSVASARDEVWQWPSAFVESGLRRLVELGRLSDTRAGEIRSSFAEAEQCPVTRMVTPGVLEVIARRR